MKKLIIALFCIVLLTGCGSLEKSIRKSFPMDRIDTLCLEYNAQESMTWAIDACLNQEFEGVCFTAQGADLLLLIQDWHLYLGI